MQIAIDEAEKRGFDRGYDLALDRVEDISAEFGADPAQCLSIMGEYVGEARQAFRRR